MNFFFCVTFTRGCGYFMWKCPWLVLLELLMMCFVFIFGGSTSDRTWTQTCVHRRRVMSPWPHRRVFLLPVLLTDLQPDTKHVWEVSCHIGLSKFKVYCSLKILDYWYVVHLFVLLDSWFLYSQHQFLAGTSHMDNGSILPKQATQISTQVSMLIFIINLYMVSYVGFHNEMI